MNNAILNLFPPFIFALSEDKMSFNFKNGGDFYAIDFGE